METIMITGRLSTSERETVLVYDSVDKMWHMDTTVLKHYNKAKRQGWTQTVEYVYEDGVTCGGSFVAPERSITIRNTEKKQMSDSQMHNLSADDEEEEEE